VGPAHRFSRALVRAGAIGVAPPGRWNARLTSVPGWGDLVFSGNEAPVGGVNDFGQDTWVLANSTSLPVPIPPFPLHQIRRGLTWSRPSPGW
jgi:hypothetical protein